MKTITVYNGKKAINEVLRETVKLNCQLDDNINYKIICGQSNLGSVIYLEVYQVGRKSVLYFINLYYGFVEQWEGNKLINKTSLELFQGYDYYKINKLER